MRLLRAPAPMRHVVLLLVQLLVGVFACAPAFAQVDVVTERYDASRLGANLAETQLTTANVNSATFGKLWSYTVSGSVYAQPLYVRNVAIPGQGTHNVLYVVTMNDVVYAFDADSDNDTPLFSRNLATGGATPVPITDIVGPVNVVGNMGIQSTPYIDLASNTMYLVAQTKEAAGSCGSVRNGRYCHRVHALDLTDFSEKFGGPVTISASVPGTGNGSSGGQMTFDALLQNQRSSLAMANGRLFIAWSSHEDADNYHGWIMSYDAATLTQTSVMCTTPNGFQGGVWMAGRAPVVDGDGNVFYMTGNGSYDGVTEWGETFLKLASTPQVAVLDWFTPSVWSNPLNSLDLDLGGSGPILIPGTDLLVGGGKGGSFYVVHSTTGAMGRLNNPDLSVQQFTNDGSSTGEHQIKGGPVYWNRDGGLGPWMYVWADSQSLLNAYRFNGTDFDESPVSHGTIPSAGASSGGVLTLSANGSTPGSGIVWASIPLPGTGDPNGGVHAGALRAFNADDLSHELWNSQINASRDSSGNWPKFSPPTVINGRVYLASFPSDGMANAPLNVYGLLPTIDFGLSATPANPGTQPGGSVSFDVDVSATGGFTGAVHLSVAGLPAGATGVFSSNDFAAPGHATLTVQTTAATPPGESDVTITGTSGALTHVAHAGLYVTTAAVGKSAISIDFTGSGAALAATDLAGVVARPNWNAANTASGSLSGLVDELGASTTAAATWSAAGTWTLGLPGTSADTRMMNGYLDATEVPTTVSVSNLPADPGGYFVYVYADGDNGSDQRTGIYAITADGQTQTIDITDAPNTNFGGTFVRAEGGAGNYAVFAVSGTSFTLTATVGPATSGTQRAPLNAIQIVHGDRIFADGFDG